MLDSSSCMLERREETQPCSAFCVLLSMAERRIWRKRRRRRRNRGRGRARGGCGSENAKVKVKVRQV